MCGIAGLLTGKPVIADRVKLVEEMMLCIAHRGPDDSGFVQISGKALIGHRRLSIIDIKHGHQPMLSADGRYCLAFNGEIYNYLELRQNLIQQGFQFETFSDTEVLLNLLIKEKEGCLPKLNGMFAFMFYDKQTGDWIASRDHFGIKPFYYSVLENEFIFASEIKSILLHPDIEPERNEEALQEYLTFQFCLDDKTLFRKIMKIKPGHVIRGNGSKILTDSCYWNNSYNIDYYHTEDYFVDALRDLISDSVRLQLRSDVSLGGYLSGGIDSSLVCSLAASHLQSPVPMFHGRFAEGLEYDESCYAKQLVSAVGGEYHEVVPTAKEFVEHLPELIYFLDEPLAGPGLFPQFHVSKLAREHVKVVLGGQGGDEIFGGYARYLVGYLEQALKGAIFENQEEGRHLVTLESIIPHLPLLKQYRPLLSQFWSDGLFDQMDARYFRLIDRSEGLKHLLTKDYYESINQNRIFADFQKIFNHPDTKSYINKMTHFDQKTLLPALLQIEDRVSMSVSIESRVPLLDYRIVDLVATMPPPLKFQGGRTKHILKKAIKNILPQNIIERKDKMGFPVPLKEWLKGGVVRDFVSDTLLSKASRERGIYRPEALENMLSNQGVGGRQLWGALCLELWHRRFIDNARN